ncbi:DUF2442 domain-containing protein [Cyclobacterium sp. SYSU L10401]|uniref:DUF2442 domain-containing protein n=1 Tax=Cyclobacterium sp. SYSU L10401 TaxID=2678657 RepID=UPI0013D0F840|nr:DUF2442 domain-containing protein [Cyclobacterium sp. SYSU L10401]
MISITKFKILDGNKIYFNFSDQSEKTIDFAPFIGEDKLSKPLSDPDYFRTVALYDHRAN